MTTAVATGTTLTLTFSENMNEDAKPSSSVFAVDVANTDDDPSIYDYTIEDDKIVLKLATAVKAGASLTVTYNKPTGANDTVLEDVGGNDLAQITARAVTNSTTDLIVVNKTSLTINESGSGNTGTFTVKLGSQPAGDVVVAVTIKGDDPPGRMDDNILDFDEDTWSTAQTVTVTGQYDANDWNDTATIHLTASQGRLKEERLGSATIALTVTDTASRNGLEITPESFSINEGSSATMSVRLTKKPASDVFVHISRNEEHDGLSLSPAQLVFTTGNYNTLQAFTLHAEEDADTDDEQFAVNLRATGGGYDYESPSLNVRTVDTGSGNTIVVDPAVLLNVPEGGSATATVTLSNAPTGEVTVAVAVGTEPTNSLSVSPASLTFTSSNYADAQTLTFSDSGDANSDDERVVATLTASGGGYDGKSVNLEVVSEDDELSDEETPPTATMIALDSSDDAVPFDDTVPIDPQRAPYRPLPRDGKIKVTFNKAVGKCALITEPVCSTDVTAWTSIDDAYKAKLFELVRLGWLDAGETRNVPFALEVSGNDVTLEPSGLVATVYDDEPKRVRLVVRDKYWSVDGGVQGASTFATWEVKAPVAEGSASPPDDAVIAGLVGQTLNLSQTSGTLPPTPACLDAQGGKATNGRNVQTSECNGAKAQDWRLEERSTGSQAGRYRLVSGLGDGSTYCLDNRGDFSDSAGMGISTCVADDHSTVENQTFDLAQAGSQGDAWTLAFTRGNARTVLWAERHDNQANGRVNQRADGSGARAEWRIAPTSAQPQPVAQSEAGISVADASVTEAAGAQLAFQVFVDRPVTSSDGTVSVDYATGDVTATAGADYAAASGTLSFALGEQSKTVHVTVLEDAHDDDGETLELTLSNPVGVSIVDGAGTGTINNSDPLPKAWLARFGRTVAEQVLAGVRERREAARNPSERVASFGGHTLGTAATEAADAQDLPEANTRRLSSTARIDDPFAAYSLERFGSGPAWGDPAWTNGFGWSDFGGEGMAQPGPAMPQQPMALDDAFRSASFSVTGKEDRFGGTLAAWGRSADSSFAGRDGTLDLDGQVASVLVGLDYARDGWLAGLLLTDTRGIGGYQDASVGSGTLRSELTAASLYGSFGAGGRLEMWGAAGIGQGELLLSPGLGEAAIADLTWQMAAAGARGTLFEPDAGGFALALVSDALVARTASDAAKVGSLVATEADISRLRVGLEGSWPLSLVFGEVTPTVEVGLRHDGGDAEVGLGVELGGGIDWHLPALGLTLDLSGRTLLAHQDDDFEDLGLSVGLVFDPAKETERGLSFNLRRDLGASAGGLDAMFAPETTLATAAAMDLAPRWTAEAAWGFAVLRERFTGSPHAGIGFADTGRDYTLGWRLAPDGTNALDIAFDFSATRRDAEGMPTEHGIVIEASLLR